jgi:hypothetical protein
MKELIVKEVSEFHKILNITESSFIDENEVFSVFTIEIEGRNLNYNKLIQFEKDLSRKLDLYSKNIILEII